LQLILSPIRGLVHGDATISPTERLGDVVVAWAPSIGLGNVVLRMPPRGLVWVRIRVPSSGLALVGARAPACGLDNTGGIRVPSSRLDNTGGIRVPSTGLGVIVGWMPSSGWAAGGATIYTAAVDGTCAGSHATVADALRCCGGSNS
jgi:hypothetical protein